MVWLLLAGAIVSEVFGTVSLRFSEGFSRPVPSVLVLLGYGLSFFLLSQALTRGLAIGVAYGIWSAAGVALIALIGAAFLGETLTWVQVGGLGAVVVGVVALQAGGAG